MKLTIKAPDVLHGDLAVAPDGGDDGVELLAPEPPVRHPQVLTLHHETQRPFVHVQHN